MKKTLLLSLTLLALMLSITFVIAATSAQAQSVTFAWDANVPAPSGGYRLYTRTGQTYNYTSAAWQGTATTCTLTLPDDVQTAAVVRAYSVGNIDGQITESGNSNEVIVSAKTGPKVPQNMIIRAIDQIIQGLMDLKKALADS
jgi:hypothetical protein